MNKKEFRKRLLECEKTTSGKHMWLDQVWSGQWATNQEKTRIEEVTVARCKACGIIDDLREEDE